MSKKICNLYKLKIVIKQGHHYLGAIYFSANPETAAIQPGDLVDVAFHPQVNEFRGERSAQLNIMDIRPSCNAACLPDTDSYTRLRSGHITAEDAALLLPDRSLQGRIWRYLASFPLGIQEDPMCLCRKIVRWSGQPLSLQQLLTCLDIFRDVGLLQIHRHHKYIAISLTPGSEKADLNTSKTMQTLLRAKES